MPIVRLSEALSVSASSRSQTCLPLATVVSLKADQFKINIDTDVFNRHGEHLNDVRVRVV